jgi:hypothetical protein
VHLQRSALDPVTVSAVQQDKGLLPRLRAAVASATGIEVPKLAEAKRVSWVNLVFGIGTLIGVWAILEVLADVRGSLDVIKGASWGWVALAFVLAQLPVVAEVGALNGAVPGQLPYGRYLALETSNTFTSLVGGRCGVRAPGQVLPAQRLRRGGGGQLRRHRVHRELDRQDPAVPRLHRLRRRRLPPAGIQAATRR